MLTFQTAEENVFECGRRASPPSPTLHRNMESLEEQSEHTFNSAFQIDVKNPRIAKPLYSRCVYGYLLEVSVFRNLHHLHLLLLSLDHERLLDVLCGTAVQWHRHNLNDNNKKMINKVISKCGSK